MKTPIISYSKKLPAKMYGLEGIQILFDISESTASLYHKTHLKDACRDISGLRKTFEIDTLKVLEICGIRQPSRFVEKNI